jgi:O-antigen/teichoic acid export membrane protein
VLSRGLARGSPGGSRSTPLSNSLGLTVVVVVNLALVPFILREVGATDYGLWILVVSITSFVSLLDIGIAAGLIKFVAEHDARGDHDEPLGCWGPRRFVYLMLGVTALLIGAGLAVVLPDLFSIEGDRRETARALMLVAALGLPSSIPGVAPVAVLRVGCSASTSPMRSPPGGHCSLQP